MNALGFIETLGLISSIEAADAMVKSANVSLIKKEYVGRGYVSVIVEGDVSAVQSAVATGVEAVKALGGELISCNVIPSPAKELEKIIKDSISEQKDDIQVNIIQEDNILRDLDIEPRKDDENTTIEDIVSLNEIQKENLNENTNENIEEETGENTSENIEKREEIRLDAYSIKTKSDVDAIVEKYGIDSCENILKVITNKQLKKIASDYSLEENINLNKLNKKDLISLIKEFYKDK